LYAPAGLDPALRDKITADVVSVLAERETRARFETAGVEVVGADGASALRQLEVDSKIATEVSSAAKIHVE
jgi:tripartite-type tricarboxylate transporter receptor subunit TctC